MLPDKPNPSGFRHYTLAADGYLCGCESIHRWYLKITLSSVTIAVNKLVKKGYVEKIRSEQDGRQVFDIKRRTMGSQSRL